MAWNSFERNFDKVSEKASFGHHCLPDVCLKDLNVGLVDFRVCGIIISKESAKAVSSKNFISNSTSERGVFTFTIRDSVEDFINVSYWGKVQFVEDIDSSFPIGSAVTIYNPQVKIKQSGSRDEEFRVDTPSRYSLMCSEHSSDIESYRGPKSEMLRSLKSVLICKPSQHCKINQILQYFNTKGTISKQSREHFTFFALVKKVGEPKEVVSRAGRKLTRCEVILCDDTCNSFPFVIWEAAWIFEATRRWVAFETTLSLVSCCVKFDDFRRGVIASADGKTILVKDPDAEETMNLKRAGQKSRLAMEMRALISEEPSCGNSKKEEEIPLESIHSVVTVEGMKRREGQGGLTSDCVFGIVFAALTKLDIDLPKPQSFLTFRCSNCHRRVDKERAFLCTTADCPMVGQDLSGADNSQVEVDFNAIVHVTDHTGTDSRCILAGEAMRELLGMKPEELAALSIQRRSEVKWQHMFQRYKIFFKASLPSFDKANPYTILLRCAPMRVSEALASFSSR